MISLHKPERATYDQVVEAQEEFEMIVCSYDPPVIECYGSGHLCCCC